jgi:hypothetical protein
MCRKYSDRKHKLFAAQLSYMVQMLAQSNVDNSTAPQMLAMTGTQLMPMSDSAENSVRMVSIRCVEKEY